MTDPNDSSPPKRVPAKGAGRAFGANLDELAARAEQEGLASFGLPDAMPEEGGDFECSIAWIDPGGDGATNDVWFSWDGWQTVGFMIDSPEGTSSSSPMTSAPFNGSAHWLDTGHLLITWTGPLDIPGHGWAVVASGATYEDEEELLTPAWWTRLLVTIDRTIIEVINGVAPDGQGVWYQP